MAEDGKATQPFFDTSRIGNERMIRAERQRAEIINDLRTRVSILEEEMTRVFDLVLPVDAKEVKEIHEEIYEDNSDGAFVDDSPLPTFTPSIESESPPIMGIKEELSGVDGDVKDPFRDEVPE